MNIYIQFLLNSKLYVNMFNSLNVHTKLFSISSNGYFLWQDCNWQYLFVILASEQYVYNVYLKYCTVIYCYTIFRWILHFLRNIFYPKLIAYKLDKICHFTLTCHNEHFGSWTKCDLLILIHTITYSHAKT